MIPPEPVSTVADFLRHPLDKLLQIEAAIPIQSPIRPNLVRAIRLKQAQVRSRSAIDPFDRAQIP